MAPIIDPIAGRIRRTSRPASAAITALLCLVLAAGCSNPPQMGVDGEAFETVDALFTAVSLREPPLVDRCAKTLETLHDEGKLPTAAFEALGAIIDDTEAGDWEASQADLRSFMLAQRR